MKFLMLYPYYLCSQTLRFFYEISMTFLAILICIRACFGNTFEVVHFISWKCRQSFKNIIVYVTFHCFFYNFIVAVRRILVCSGIVKYGTCKCMKKFLIGTKMIYYFVWLLRKLFQTVMLINSHPFTSLWWGNAILHHQ